MKDISANMKTVRLKKRDIGDRNIYGPVELASFVGVYFFLYSEVDIAQMQCQLYDSDDGKQWNIVSKTRVIDRPVNNDGHGRVISYIGGKKFLQIESTIPVDTYVMFRPDAIPNDGDFSGTGYDTSTNVPSMGGSGNDNYDHTVLEKQILELTIIANAAQAMANAAGEAATIAKGAAEEAQTQSGVAIDTATEAHTIASGLQGKIDLVQETAANAKSIAQEATKDSAQAAIDAENALGIANEMSGRISEVRLVANAAEIKADSAVESATSAEDKADGAIIKAQEAKDDLQAHVDEVTPKFTQIDLEIDHVLDVANEAKDNAQAAQDTADDAKEIANNADTLANANAGEINTIKENLSGIETKADSAKSIAENAQTEASASSDTASEAKAKSQEVEAIANEAKDTADSALTAATSASTNSDNAVTIATEAKSLAEANETNVLAIQSTANAAKTAADSAVAKADSVKAIADSAVESAEDAQEQIATFSSKIEEIEGVADGASTLAGEAKEEALSAKATAQSIEAKADQGIEDAATAQETADEAKTLATSAQTTANAAATTAADAATLAETASNQVAGLTNAVQTAQTMAEEAGQTAQAAQVQAASSVQNYGDQEIDGVKTFNENPLAPNPASDPAKTINPLALVPLAYIQSLLEGIDGGAGFDVEAFKLWLETAYVKLTGDQTIGGVKTFSNSPQVPGVLPGPPGTIQTVDGLLAAMPAEEMTSAANVALVKTAVEMVNAEVDSAKTLAQNALPKSGGQLTGKLSLLVNAPGNATELDARAMKDIDFTGLDGTRIGVIRAIAETDGSHVLQVAPVKQGNIIDTGLSVKITPTGEICTTSVTPSTSAPNNAIQTKESVARDYLAKSGGEIMGNLSLCYADSHSIRRISIKSAPDKNLVELIATQSGGTISRGILRVFDQHSDTGKFMDIALDILPDGTTYATSPPPRDNNYGTDVVTTKALKDYAPQKLTANVDLHLDAVNGSDTADLNSGRGLSADNAFKSLAALIYWARTHYIGSYIVNVILHSDITAPGTTPMIPFYELAITSDETRRTLSIGENDSFGVGWNRVTLRNLNINQGLRLIAAGIGTTSILTLDNVSISSPALQLLALGSGAQLILQNNIAVSGAIANGMGFVRALSGGTVNCSYATFTGSITTGWSYEAKLGGKVLNGGREASTLPGSGNGITDENSFYA